MSNLEVITNRVIVLGGGLVPDAERPEQLALSPASVERADSTLDYYYAHAAAFAGKQAMIICSGGASAIYDGLDVSKLSATQTEGALLADHLLRGGIPAGLIEEEKESNTTTLNIVNSIEAGFLKPEEFDAHNPLGVGTHKNHYLRVLLDLHDAGFAPDSSTGIHPAHEDSAMKERVLRGIRKGFFAGVQPGDLHAMRERNARLTRAFGRTK